MKGIKQMKIKGVSRRKRGFKRFSKSHLGNLINLTVLVLAEKEAKKG
jgi:hypothetical protein